MYNKEGTYAYSTVHSHPLPSYLPTYLPSYYLDLLDTHLSVGSTIQLNLSYLSK